MNSRSASSTPDLQLPRRFTGGAPDRTWPKCGFHTTYVSTMNVEKELVVKIPLNDIRDIREERRSFRHRLIPGVDHAHDEKGKHPARNVDSSGSSDSEHDAGEEIGTEQHRFQSPAPRPMRSELAQDISVDLMRMRRKSQYSPRRTSSYAGSRPPTSLASLAPSQKGKVSAEWSLTASQLSEKMTGSFRVLSSSKGDMSTDDLSDNRTERASTSCSQVNFANMESQDMDSPRAADDAPDSDTPRGGPIVRTSDKILKDALGLWQRTHMDHLAVKQRILTQYLGCCAFLKRSPFLKNQLRTFLLTPSSDALGLSGLGISSKDIAAVLSALSGQGCGLKPSKVTTLSAVCAEMGDPGLASLDLSHNALGGEGAATLASMVVQADFFRIGAAVPDAAGGFFHTALTELNLARNAVGAAGSKAVEALLRSGQCSLIRLDLTANLLGDPGCGRVLQGLYSNTTVTWLSLADNAASHAAGMALGAVLERNTVLQRLDLDYNHLRGAGARRVGTGLGRNTALQVLRLQWNGFGDEEVMTELAKAVPVCGVTELNLSHNRIRLRGAAILASCLECGSNLKELILDGNLIGQIGARVVFRAVQQATALGQEFPTSVSLEGCGTNIVDRAAFDPCETAGGYNLDLRDSYSRSVLAKLIRVSIAGSGSFVPVKVKGKNSQFNATLAGGHVRIADNGSIDVQDWAVVTATGVNLPISESLDEAGQPIPLQRTWAKLLKRREEDVATVISFSFNNDRRRAAAGDCLSQRNLDMLAAAFGPGGATPEKSIEVIETIFGSDVFISIEQMQFLLEQLSDTSDMARYAAMGQVRVAFIARCFHKLVESDRNVQLLDMLASTEERKALEKALGSASFEFTANNPTGYHKLDLSDGAQREICLRLVEISNAMSPRLRQLEDFYYAGRRAGGRREEPSEAPELERVWRNSRLDGKATRFGPSWRVPYGGLVEVDFVQITKPDPKEARSSGEFSMREGTFRALMAALDKPEVLGRERISLLRRYSNTELFTCQQLAAILELFDQPELRAEVCVIAYARTLDWHGFKNLTLRLSLREVKMLHHRIGLINLWDDVMAVDYYELDLARSSDRFIMQELLHIAAVEPGDNMVDGTYLGIDHTVPAGWLKEVPRNGVISFYYCREQPVIEKVFEKGAWGNQPSPFHLREDGTEFGSTSWSTFAPQWLLRYGEASPAAGPAPCPQPRETSWVRPYKIRRIKMKMMDKFQDARSMFDSLDRDGGGSLDRKELAMGLFALGIWLAPTELQALLSILDKDGGGDIDFEEFEEFWDEYTFD